jgi:ABC-2 type transport system ATP-binding protein
MGLGEWIGARVDTLSKGMQQKVQFVTTVLHRPELLILDEPHAGLDPVNQEVLRETILQAKADGRTVVLSTHNMGEAERMCDSVCIIASGRKVLDGAVREVRRAHRANRFYVEFDGGDGDVDRFMTANRHVAEAKRRGAGWELELRPGFETRSFVGQLNELGPLAHFEHLQPTLHDIFVARVGGAARPTRRPEPAHA